MTAHKKNARLSVMFLFSRMAYFCTLIVALSGCAGCPYSFTGAAVPDHWKTIAIPLFDDASSYGEPGLRERLTNAVIDKIQQDNILQLGDVASADVVLKATITSVQPEKALAIRGQGNMEQASLLRFEITVTVQLDDKVLNKQVWKKTFTNYGDYEATGGGISQRERGIEQAIEKLSEDIVLETVSGW